MAEGLLILGLGNVLCGDDGLGVAAVERLRRAWTWPATVDAVDGGTLGLALLGRVADADDLLIVDAVRAAAPAGTPVRLSGADVAPAVRERLSVHQVGVADLLDALELLGRAPRRMVLLGLVPETLELGVGCSPAVAARLDDLVEAVAAAAAELGHPLRRRSQHEAVAIPSDPAAARRPGPDRSLRALGL